MATITTTTQSASPQGPSTQTTGRNPYKFAFALITAMFFIFGFITCLNDILVPHLKSLFTLSYTQAALIQFCFFTAYFFASLPSGRLVTRFGYKQGTVVGLLITAIGCLCFYPAAGMRSYPIFLVGLFVLAVGITLIQVAVNPYVAILGPSRTASARLNLAQAFNSLGTTIAPMFGSYLILSAGMKSEAEVKAMDTASQAAFQATQASSVQGPYIGLAIVLVVLAVVVGLSHLPKIVDQAQAPATSGAGTPQKQQDLPSAWRYRHLVLGAIGIFCYVGAEVAIGSYLINFMELPEIMAYPAAVAGKYVALYWGGAMVGRFIGSGVLRKVRPGRMLAFNAMIASTLVLGAMAMHGPVAMAAILAVGLFNSIMFPTIFTLAIDGLGKNTAQGSGILCMAIVGGAVVPLLQGRIADGLGLHHSFFLPVACYLFIMFYGLRGYRHAFGREARKAGAMGVVNQVA